MTDEVLEEFRKYLVRQAKAVGTQKIYVRAAAEFFQYQETTPERATRDDVTEFMEYFIARPEKYSRNSARLRGAALRKFFGWYSREYGVENPAADMRPLRENRVDPRLVSPWDITRMLEMSDRAFANEVVARRNAALIALLADTGIRVGECELLRMSSVKVMYSDKGVPRNMELVVPQTKGTYARTVPFGLLDDTRMCTEAFLRYWLWLKFEEKQPEKWPLFFRTERHSTVITMDQPLMRGGIAGVLERIGRKAGCADKVNPHAFRHFYGTYFYVNSPTKDLELLRQLMGHASIETTARYIHVAARLDGGLLRNSATASIKTDAGGFASLLLKMGVKR